MLREWLEEMAFQNNRSMSREIEYVLIEYYRKDLKERRILRETEAEFAVSQCRDD